ncbi:MAG: hypothetical protein GY750_04515 [Lentisphaerae bacterium]|nr:hypothetical protein [Lentisphaerota bacterium]MCP4100674.1 hypothetical protein [Lentisphaerota bacterium]
MIGKEYLDVDPGSALYFQTVADAALNGKAGSELSDGHRIFCTTFSEKTFGSATEFDVYDGGATSTAKAALIIERFELRTSNGVTTGSMTGIAHEDFVNKLFSGGGTTNYTFEIDGFNKNQHVSTKVSDDNVWFQMVELKSGGPLNLRIKNRQKLQVESSAVLGVLTRFYLMDFQMINTGQVVFSWANQIGCPDTIEFAPNQ